MAEPPTAAAEARSPGSGRVIYYRHPGGDPAWSAELAKTSDGRDFVPVLASEDVSFADKPESAEADPDMAEAGSGGAPAAERKILYYRNPMGLPDTSRVPKKDSMGMDYIPVYEGEADGGSTVRVPLGKLQRTGVRTAEVTMERLPTALRVPGIVMLDDRRIHAVSMRSDSFIEEVASVTAGSRVKAGESLFKFYSKEVATAASEYANVVSGGGDTAGSALRLRNLGMSERAIETIRRDRKVPPSISFDAPADGIVIERATTPEAWPSRATSCSGSPTPGRCGSWPTCLKAARRRRSRRSRNRNRQRQARRASPRHRRAVDPEIRDQTRTARVRIRIPNPNGTLLPNMFGTIEISSGSPDPVVTVPNDAIIDTGSRRVVFVDKGDGRFEPCDIEVGVRGRREPR